MRILRTGGIVAYPTEAVYGLGCDPGNPDAVSVLTTVKRRCARQGFILIAADLQQAIALIKMPEGQMGDTVRASWPGHTTWVFPAGAGAPPWLTGVTDTLAVRVTAHPLAASLCRAFGSPIVSTSANLRGAPPAKTALEVREGLPAKTVDYILCGRVGGHLTPSEIRDARDGRVLRRG